VAYSSERGLERVLAVEAFGEITRVEAEVVVSQIRSLNQSIRRLDEEIGRQGPKLEGHDSLTSIKGVGTRSAVTLLSVIGKVEDFADENKLASYFGIVPVVKQSNETGAGGDDPLSRDFNFTVPLLGLKGRAGLDLGLSLSYNSLVWTRDAATGAVKFDADYGDPSPGFRLGPPVIQRRYRNARGEDAYMMVTSSGGHVELRRVGTSNTYEAADSSYTQLTEETGGLTLRPADGSRLSYSLQGSQYKCTRVEDRNGNFITLAYNAAGEVSSFTDTLGRVVTVSYDGNGRPLAVEQSRAGQVHQWATFGYTNVTMGAGFDTQHVSVLGPANGTAISVLSQVSLDDGSRYNFLYNSWGQVYRTERHAPDGRLLSYTEYDLQSPTAGKSAVTRSPGWSCRGLTRLTSRAPWVPATAITPTGKSSTRRIKQSKTAPPRPTASGTGPTSTTSRRGFRRRTQGLRRATSSTTSAAARRTARTAAATVTTSGTI
jgi:YD repeat-containing protein